MLLTQKTNLDVNTNEEQKEILPIAKESFPYLCSTTRLDCTPDKSVPWHWHNMFEISFIIKGELSLQTPDETHIISIRSILTCTFCPECITAFMRRNIFSPLCETVLSSYGK